MLSEEEIRRALNASRVIPLDVRNPHGPLGLEELAATVKRRLADGELNSVEERVRRAIDLPAETWARLDQLATETSRATSSRVRPSDLAASIIEEYLAASRR
jgi:hypothetical protein